MAQSLLAGTNPVLTRELRAGLRNVRAFALLAIYVALLGAIATIKFPSDQQIDLQLSGGVKGQDLFWTLVWGQVALILALIPALSTGALAQERERQTLEALLLTPLSPLQIVWGKAGGVLSLIGLLLLASLPLTSLCFLLGGVSPGMLIAAYAGIFGLAIFTTGFGLYCAARWPGATRALLACYALLPIAISIVMVFLPLGSLFSGFCVLAMMGYALLQGWKRGDKSGFAQKLGPLYGKVIYLLVPLLLGGLLLMMAFNRNIGLIVVGVGFVLSYFVMAAQWGLLQTARELMLRQDPEAPMRQKIADFKSDWQNAIAPPSATGLSAGGLSLGESSVYVPTPQTQGEWAAVTNRLPSPTPSSIKKAPKTKDSYGKAPFLSDRLNPIYARELRAGLLGKFEYLFRFSYILTILSEVGLLVFLLMGIYDPSYLMTDYSAFFAFWGRWHLALLMTFGAWFGARSIAPEREGQTLSQLFTIPLRPEQIIGGKMAAVLTFTFYILVLAVPLAVLLALTGLVPWGLSLRFLLGEVVLGSLAAAWGLYCSFHCQSVRAALSCSLGGTVCVLLVHFLILPLWDLLHLLGLPASNHFDARLVEISPVRILFPLQEGNNFGLGQSATSFWALPIVLALAFYLILGVFFLLQTARNFRRLAREA